MEIIHQSYRYFMQENLFNQKPFKESFLPRGLRTMLKLKLNATTKFWLTIQLTSKSWESVANGHIGFNEPGTPFDSQTHLVELDQSTIEANARFLTRLKTFQLKPFQWELKHLGCQVNYSLCLW